MGRLKGTGRGGWRKRRERARERWEERVELTWYPKMYFSEGGNGASGVTDDPDSAPEVEHRHLFQHSTKPAHST